MRRHVALSALLLGASVLTSLSLGTACTVVRNAQPPPPDDPVGVVDMLVLTSMAPAASNLSGPYETILFDLFDALESESVLVRRVAVAPLHSRVGAEVPLLHGAAPDELAMGRVTDEYTLGGPSVFLVDRASDDYANLLELGARLSQAPLRDDVEGLTGTAGAAFFTTPADGLVVVVLSALAPRCETDCLPLAREHVDALTRGGAEGQASWLDLPLPVRNVSLLTVTTAEVGGDYDALRESCRRAVGFPDDLLDFLEPSGTPYHSAVVAGLRERGLTADALDICRVLARGADAFESSAERVADSLGR